MVLVHFSDSSVNKRHTMILLYTFTFECLVYYKVRKGTLQHNQKSYIHVVYFHVHVDISFSYFSYFRKKNLAQRRK